MLETVQKRSIAMYRVQRTESEVQEGVWRTLFEKAKVRDEVRFSQHQVSEPS